MRDPRKSLILKGFSRGLTDAPYAVILIMLGSEKAMSPILISSEEIVN